MTSQRADSEKGISVDPAELKWYYSFFRQTFMLTKIYTSSIFIPDRMFANTHGKHVRKPNFLHTLKFILGRNKRNLYVLYLLYYNEHIFVLLLGSSKI